MFQHVSALLGGVIVGKKHDHIFQQLPWGLQVISPPDVGQVG
jgi:F0F1-type ATP synthase assembly protein I